MHIRCYARIITLNTGKKSGFSLIQCEVGVVLRTQYSKFKRGHLGQTSTTCLLLRQTKDNHDSIYNDRHECLCSAAVVDNGLGLWITR